LNPQKATSLLKSKAYQLGFDFVGISNAKKLESDEARLENWLKKNNNATMSYMEKYYEKRLDPRKLVPGTQSVVTFLFNYHTPNKQSDMKAPKLAKYAYGKDYHFVIKEKLKELFNYLKVEIGSIEGRYFVDSAPVLDRAWARESGLGWIGKNSMLINKNRGSDFFIATMMLDFKFEADGPIKDYCGNCTRCIDSCPTDAILDNRTINSNQCISFLTIELRDSQIPEQFANKMNNWAFGCDICQDVCPWNRFASMNKEPQFLPNEELMNLNSDEWHAMEKEQFDRLFKKSAVKRTKFVGLKRNLDFLKKSSQKLQ
tara:strand:+ start:352 stop:1296 length:945 start_codon:yes stop_codon:yes gene_type:complete